MTLILLPPVNGHMMENVKHMLRHVMGDMLDTVNAVSVG